MAVVRELVCVSQLDRYKCTFAQHFLSVSHAVDLTIKPLSEKVAMSLELCTFLYLVSDLHARALSMFKTFIYLFILPSRPGILWRRRGKICTKQDS